jgi:hypothetical protein
MDGEPPEVEDKKTEGEDVIDPVMKQYMEMVQQQKDKEKEVCLLSLYFIFIFLGHLYPLMFTLLLCRS